MQVCACFPASGARPSELRLEFERPDKQNTRIRRPVKLHYGYSPYASFNERTRPCTCWNQLPVA